MTPVSHGKPCAGNPHARFDEGASASEEPRRNALLHDRTNCIDNTVSISSDPSLPLSERSCDGRCPVRHVKLEHVSCAWVRKADVVEHAEDVQVLP